MVDRPLLGKVLRGWMNEPELCDWLEGHTKAINYVKFENAAGRCMTRLYDGAFYPTRYMGRRIRVEDSWEWIALFASLLSLAEEVRTGKAAD